ncbi:hypothetical protein NIES4075_20630 [Tolypothrix sp. NIES-4075]|uniref:hypothetical protein n=1 Tax=Tolypothrix sp. NIES-4075 TaxID=2005459 RepID=UPI000B6BB444|nr:hypothetical protein [Tolypothrix sp. NIES-4075]GAX41094.1 hypothetical protein NIES4075_20630 [Tolypothrix sp. NIES-4075]
MSRNPQSSWHHTLQKDILSVTLAHLELVPERASDLERRIILFVSHSPTPPLPHSLHFPKQSRYVFKYGRSLIFNGRLF